MFAKGEFKTFFPSCVWIHELQDYRQMNANMVAELAELRKSTPGKKSMGMNITKDRMEIINKIYNTNTKVNITDRTDENEEAAGTTVELLIPV